METHNCRFYYFFLKMFILLVYPSIDNRRRCVNHPCRVAGLLDIEQSDKKEMSITKHVICCQSPTTRTTSAAHLRTKTRRSLQPYRTTPTVPYQPHRTNRTNRTVPTVPTVPTASIVNDCKRLKMT